MTQLSRRRFVQAVGTIGAPLIVTRPGWSQTGPIKIGALEPQSGPIKYIGDNDLAALRFSADRLNAAGGLLGRKVEIVAADSEMKPDVSARRATDLVLGEKVDFLTGLGSSVGKSLAAVAWQHKKIFFTATSEAAELTGPEFHPTTFRCNVNTDMHGGQLATYFTRIATRKPTKFYLLNQDYNFGRETAEGFKKKFARTKLPQQTIVGEAYHPFQKVQDFGPYITAITGSGADVVITGNYGQDLRLLLQQGSELGWKVTVGNFFLDPPILRVLGKAAIGHVVAADYMLTIDTVENREFIRQWRDRYPEAPLASRFPELNMGRNVYAVLWLADVVRRAGTVETEKLIKAWEGSTFKTAWGEVEMRACDHQMLTPGWVAQVLEPERIPADFRYFGHEFPYMGPASRIAREDMTVPPAESGNKRCV